MEIIVAVQAPIPDAEPLPVTLSRITVQLRLVDSLNEEQLRELETDLSNTIHLFCNTWGLS